MRTAVSEETMLSLALGAAVAVLTGTAVPATALHHAAPVPAVGGGVAAAGVEGRRDGDVGVGAPMPVHGTAR